MDKLLQRGSRTTRQRSDSPQSLPQILSRWKSMQPLSVWHQSNSLRWHCTKRLTGCGRTVPRASFGRDRMLVESHAENYPPLCGLLPVLSPKLGRLNRKRKAIFDRVGNPSLTRVCGSSGFDSAIIYNKSRIHQLSMLLPPPLFGLSSPSPWLFYL